MKIFTIYFEVFGRKLKKDIEAYSDYEAKEILRLQLLKSLKYHKVEGRIEPQKPDGLEVEFLKGIFGIR